MRTKPERVVIASLQVTMDSGSTRYFDAYRVQYDSTLGPTKGGIRYHHEVDLAEVTELARLMSLKCSLAGLPYGGAKGGISVDPSTLSRAELERLTRAYVRAFADVIGPFKDIPAPDVNTNAQIMGWFIDEWRLLQGAAVSDADWGVVTGKPLDLHGSEGRDEATGLGAAYIIEEFTRQSEDKKGITVAIQGFGNAGGTLAQFLHEWGYTVVAVSDATTAIYNEQGLDVPALLAHTGMKQKLQTYSGDVQRISNEELLKLPVHLLAPAALGHQITETNATQIQARSIVEVANGPVSTAADAILATKNIPVLPDVMVNAGGVIVSYFEWYQNTHGEHWDKSKVRTQLKEKMTDMFSHVSRERETAKGTWRNAAQSIAVKRIESGKRG